MKPQREGEYTKKISYGSNLFAEVRERVSPAEAAAVRWREPLEHWADILTSGALDDQMEIFRDREALERLCGTILKGSQTKAQAG